MQPEIRAIHHPADGQVVIELPLSPGSPAFAGHFPDEPILPGVVQIHWVTLLATAHLGISVPAATDFQVKYRRVARPGDLLSLALRLDRAKGALFFDYTAGGEAVSSGRIRLGAPA